MSEKVLITGATGFIGSHLTEIFVENGFDVCAFDRYNSNGDLGWLEFSQYKNDIEFILGDIRDYDSVANALKGCKSIFHLAALIGIPYSYVSPLAYIRTNIEGTYNVLEAARNQECSNILITSTSETYGTAQYVPIDENHPSVGQSPYSASKIAADQLALSYFKSFDQPIKIVRPFNTFGPRQSSRAIIPTIISQIFLNKKELKLGSLSPTRDLTFVKDTVSGFLEIFKSNKLFGEAVNIGNNNEISIGSLAQNICQIMGKEISIIEENKRIRPKNSEVERLFCDNSKLLNETKWKPRFTLNQGLEETISWMERNRNFFNGDEYAI